MFIYIGENFTFKRALGKYILTNTNEQNVDIHFIIYSTSLVDGEDTILVSSTILSGMFYEFVS